MREARLLLDRGERVGIVAENADITPSHISLKNLRNYSTQPPLNTEKNREKFLLPSRKNNNFKLVVLNRIFQR